MELNCLVANLIQVKARLYAPIKYLDSVLLVWLRLQRLVEKAWQVRGHHGDAIKAQLRHKLILHESCLVELIRRKVLNQHHVGAVILKSDPDAAVGDLARASCLSFSLLDLIQSRNGSLDISMSHLVDDILDLFLPEAASIADHVGQLLQAL